MKFVTTLLLVLNSLLNFIILSEVATTCVKVEDSGLYLFSFYFSFLFFIFLFLDLELEVSIISYNMILCYISIICHSHSHMITYYTEGQRRFQNNNVI